MSTVCFLLILSFVSIEACLLTVLHRHSPSFALVILAPYQVDVVDLGRSKRSTFELAQERKPGQSEEWSEKRLVP